MKPKDLLNNNILFHYPVDVSLCVREWIEIYLNIILKKGKKGLPLREGVDLK